MPNVLLIKYDVGGKGFDVDVVFGTHNDIRGIRSKYASNLLPCQLYF